MLKVENIASLVDRALLDIINGADVCAPDASGRYHINLRRRDVQEMVTQHVSVALSKGRWFGAGNVIYASCCQEDNWRRGEQDRPGGCAKYRIVDGSVNLDVHDLSYLSDRMLVTLKKTVSNHHIIMGETVDFTDFESIVTEKLGIQIVNGHADEIIVCDANGQYAHDTLFYDRQVLEVEMKLRENDLF